jgi:hypothetical protein
MNMSLRDLFLADDAHEVQDDELDEELKARWSLLGHALTGRGFMLEEPTIDALCNPWMSLVSAPSHLTVCLRHSGLVVVSRPTRMPWP